MVHVIAPRIAEQLAPHPAALIVAPKEFQPVQVAEAAMQLAHGEGGYRHVWLPDEPEQVLAAFLSGEPVLVEVTDPDPRLGTGLREVAEAALAGSAPNQVVVALADDVAPETIFRHPFTLVLDHRSLVATMNDVGEVHPELAGQEQLLQRVSHHTGGAAELLEVPGAGRPDYPDQVARAARGWAERIYQHVRDDPVLTLQLWLGRAPQDTFAEIGSAALGAEPAKLDLSHIDERPWVTAPGALLPGLPGGLAEALRDLMAARDPVRAAGVRTAVARVAISNERVRGLDRLSVLTVLKDWEGVDRVLATKLHLLATLPQGHREWFSAQWPPRVAPRLTHLAQGRRFLLGSASATGLPIGTPQHWAELFTLMRGEETPPLGSLRALVLQRLGELARRHSFDVETGRRELTSLMTWVGEQVQRYEARPVHQQDADDATLLRVLLLALSDSAVTAGEVAQAQQCVRHAMRLGVDMDTARVAYPTLWTPTLARAAFMSALGGQARLTEQRLTRYEQAIRVVGPPDAQSARLVAVARRFPRDVASVLDDPTSRPVDPLLPHAAFEANAEGQRALLLHGPDAASQWVHTMLSKATWSERPSWEWWPLHAFAALVDAREGRVGLAQSWLDRAFLPPALDLTVRAGIELASGRPDSAERLADQVLALEDASTRWRYVAMGIKMSCCPESSVSDHRCQLLLDSEDWASALGSVSLFPRRGREMVLTRLDAVAASLPGLAVGHVDASAIKDVKLTPDNGKSCAPWKRE